MRRYIAVFAACLVFVAMIAGCHSENNPTEVSELTEVTQQTGETESADTAETETTEAPESTYSDRIEISTKFGSLYYQDQWEDFMKVELVEEEASATVAFVAEIDGVRYSLFQLIVGESDNEPVGQITDAQGVKHDVSVYMEEISGISELTEGEQNRLFAMQEEINYVIENMK